MPNAYEFTINGEKLQEVLEEIKTRYPYWEFIYLEKSNRIYNTGDNIYILSRYLIPFNYVRRIY